MRLAYAVVRDDPPAVFVADSVEVLQRVIALRVVARTSSSRLEAASADRMRAALLEERWGEAVALWIDHSGVPVDVYGNVEVWDASKLGDDNLDKIEMQFTPLFNTSTE
jgi:hypothetical protein